MRLRRAVLQNPAKCSVSPELPFHNSNPLLTHAESTLLQLLIPLHFNSLRINTYKKPGGGSPTPTPNVLQLVNPSLFVIPSEARNLIFPFSSLSHYLVTSLHPISAALHAHSNARNPIPFTSLLHSSLDTGGLGPYPSPRPTRPSPLADMSSKIRTSTKPTRYPFRIRTSKTRGLKSFRIRTYRKTRGGALFSTTSHWSQVTSHGLRSRYISRNLQGGNISQRLANNQTYDRRRSSGAAAIPRRRSSSA